MMMMMMTMMMMMMMMMMMIIPMIAHRKLRCHAYSRWCSNFAHLVKKFEPLQYQMTHLAKLKDAGTNKRKLTTSDES